MTNSGFVKADLPLGSIAIFVDGPCPPGGNPAILIEAIFKRGARVSSGREDMAVSMEVIFPHLLLCSQFSSVT